MHVGNMKPADSGVDQHVLLKTKPKPDDETRAFLTFSSSGDDIDSRSSVTSIEQGGFRRSVGPLCGRSSWNSVSICLLVAVALLGVTVLVLEVYRGREVVGLRAELDAMRRDVESLKHRILEEDLLEQFKAFEAAVYAEEAATEDNDDDSYDDESSEDDLDEDYDLDYDGDEVQRNSKKQLLHSSEEHHKHKADQSQETVGRTKREISSSVVPVISESYGVDFNHNNNSSEGLRLYESLVANGGKNEPKDSSLDWGSTENPIKNYHRVSPLWSPKSHHKKYVGAPAQLNEAPSYRRHRERSPSGTTHAPSPIISRVSRVMQTDPNDSLLQKPPPPRAPLRLHPQHKLPDGEVVVRVYQEQRAPQSGTVAAPGDAEVLGKNRRRKKRPPQKSLSSLTQGPRLLAIHYDGDSSKYQHGHAHYAGNGRLRHPDGKFTDWTPSNWTRQLGMARHFPLHDGVVTVHMSGIYFIYAQIYYVDEHDINGFRVYINNDAILHCTTMTVHLPSEQRRPKSNTCHTSAAIYLAEGDKVSVRDVNGLRYSLFEPAKSFFGLVKLSDVRLK